MDDINNLQKHLDSKTKPTIKLYILEIWIIFALCFTKADVEKFLADFSVKVKIFGIRFRDDRAKNQNALFELGITPSESLNVIMKLDCYDYSEGPVVDALNDQGEMWVFGKDVKGNEVYIKITMGHPNAHTICISFHKAEHPMFYPFKNSRDEK